MRSFKPVLGRVVEGPYKGLIFSFLSIKETREYFNSSNIYKAINNENMVYRHCRFRRCTKEEAIPYHGLMTKRISESVGRRFRPILGTVLKGPYAGFKFTLKSSAELDQYFTPSNIYAVINGKLKTHKNCTFQYCNLENFTEYQNRMTLDILNSIERKFKPILGRIEKGPHTGFLFTITSTNELVEFFLTQNVYSIIGKEGRTSRGCSFKYISQEEAVLHKNKLTKAIFKTIK